MAPRSSTKNCLCTECLESHGLNGRDWDSREYKGHRARVRAASVSSASVSPEAIAAASEELFISALSNDHITSLPSSRDNAVAEPTARSSTSLRHNINESSRHEIDPQMPPLAEVSDDEDDEDDKAPIRAGTGPRSERKKMHNKSVVRDRTILENAQSKISDCARQLSPSPDRLKDTKITIEQCRMAVNKIASKHSDIISLKSKVVTLLGNLEARWMALSSLVPDNAPLEYSTGKIQTLISDSRTNVPPLDQHFTSSMRDSTRMVQLVVFIGLWFIGIVGGSRAHGDFLVSLLSIGFYWAFQPPNSQPMDSRHQSTIAQMPANIREVLSHFDLESRTVIYAVCPTCHCTYAPQFALGNDTPEYPSHCTHRPTPESGVCGQPLLRRNRSEKSQPIKPFVYYSFHDYLAALLSRKDLEGLMDKACDDLHNASCEPLPEFASDVWDAEFLRKFEGPGKALFVARGTEGRYLFAFNYDSFNVEGMRIRGATTSCGLLSMVCLNLPPDIRYKAENMYVAGIIPGPHSPKETQLNHYLRPLIDDLEVSWHRGVKYSRTALYSEGRVTLSAIAVGPMDLPAARSASQLAHPTAHIYCTVCTCRDRKTLGRVDHDKWTLRDDTVIKEHAESWKEAGSLKDRDDIVKEHGTRYSELWRLPYWSPVSQLPVDPMHCLLENLIAIHFRYNLGLTAADAASPDPPIYAFSHNFTTIDKPTTPPPGLSSKEAKQVGTIHQLLTSAYTDDEEDDAQSSQLRKRLMDKNIPALKFVCNDLGLVPRPRLHSTKLFKKDWVSALMYWVSLVCLCGVQFCTNQNTAAFQTFAF